MQFNEQGQALETGDIIIYHFDAFTGLLGGSETYHAIQGFGLPAYSTTQVPPTIPEGQVAVFQNGAWVLTVDNTQTKVWNKADGSPAWGCIGPLPSTVITVEPTGAFVSWDDTQSKWVFNQSLRDTQMKARAQVALQQARNTVYNNYGIIGEDTPANWVSYLKALMAIANGSDTTSTVLPTEPAQ